MTLLILGIVLWYLPHSAKTLMPALHSAMGSKAKGIIALGTLASVVLMVIGYRAAPMIEVWTPPAFMTHINNLLMVVAIAIFSMNAAKGKLRAAIRHPMLTGVKTWAIAHLLVNGDLASIILFGSMLAWAVLMVIRTNKTKDYVRPEITQTGMDIRYIAVTVITFVIIVGVHAWVGPWPFG